MSAFMATLAYVVWPCLEGQRRNIPTNSLPWRHPTLQNDTSRVEEENERDFTRVTVHTKFFRLIFRQCDELMWCDEFFPLIPLRKKVKYRSDSLRPSFSNYVFSTLASATAMPAATRLISHVRFSVSKAPPPLENRNSSHCLVSIGLMDELLGFWFSFLKPNTEFNSATLKLH